MEGVERRIPRLRFSWMKCCEDDSVFGPSRLRFRLCDAHGDRCDGKVALVVSADPLDEGGRDELAKFPISSDRFEKWSEMMWLPARSLSAWTTLWDFLHMRTEGSEWDLLAGHWAHGCSGMNPQKASSSACCPLAYSSIVSTQATIQLSWTTGTHRGELSGSLDP